MNTLHLKQTFWLAAVAGFLAFAPLGHGAEPKPACRCPDCGHAVCRLVREPVIEERSCFQVTCKQICIPAIRWPWQSCCDAPKCGKVKTVKVLKKVDYECQECGYRWQLQPAGCGAGG